MSIFDPATTLLDGLGNETKNASRVTEFEGKDWGTGRFLPDNYLHIAGTQITSSVPDHGDHVAASLSNPDPDLVFSALQNTMTVTIKLPTRQALDGFGIAHSLGYGGTIRVELYLQDVLQSVISKNAQAPLYAWGDPPGWGMMAWNGYPFPTDPGAIEWPLTDIWLTESVVADKIVMQFDDEVPLTVGYITAGRAFVPCVNMDRLPQFAPVDPVDYEDTPGGATVVGKGNSKRTFSTTWSWLTSNEIARLVNILSNAKNRGLPFLFSYFPGRSGQIEQQGTGLCYPISWTPPVEARGDGPFTLKAREVLFNV